MGTYPHRYERILYQQHHFKIQCLALVSHAPHVQVRFACRRPETLRACFQPLVTPGYHNAHSQKALEQGGYPNLSLHKLRHTFATLLKEGGVDLDTIGSLLGHSDRSATEIYAHITDNRQRAALSAIPCGKVVLEN